MDKFNLSAAFETLITYLVDGYQISPESLEIIFSSFHADYTIDVAEIVLNEYVIKHQLICDAVTIYAEVIFPTLNSQGLVHLLKVDTVDHEDVVLHHDVMTYKTRCFTRCPIKIHPVHWRIWEIYRNNNYAYSSRKLTIKLLIIKKKGVITYPYNKV